MNECGGNQECPRCKNDSARCPMNRPVRVEPWGNGHRLLDSTWALMRAAQECEKFQAQRAQQLAG